MSFRGDFIIHLAWRKFLDRTTFAANDTPPEANPYPKAHRAAVALPFSLAVRCAAFRPLPVLAGSSGKFAHK